MGRSHEGNNRFAAISLAVGIASAPIAMDNNIGGTPGNPVLRTTNSAPVKPLTAPQPLREEKRTRSLGESVRTNIRALGIHEDVGPEPKTHAGKFSSNDEGFQYSANNVSAKQRNGHSRSSHRNYQKPSRSSESEFSPSNDLGLLARQELEDTTLNDRQVSRKIKAAVDAVLDPHYVSKNTRIEMDLQDQITAIIDQAALYDEDPAETATKVEALKSAAEEAKKPEERLSPEPKESLGAITLNGKKPRPLTQEEQAAFVEYLFNTITEGKTLKVMEDGKIELTSYMHYDRLYTLLNVDKKSTVDFDHTAIDQFVADNLDAFRAKTHEARIQKLIHTQLAQTLDGRDKTRTKERRQGHRASLILDSEQLALEELAGHPIEEDEVIADDASQSDESANDTQGYVFDKSQDYHGHDPKVETAKAEAYLASLQTPSTKKEWGVTTITEFDDTDILPKTGRRAAKAALSRVSQTRYEEA